jgi:hypothetical protein
MAELVVILLSHAVGLDALQIRRTWVRDQIPWTYLPEICVDTSRRRDYGNGGRVPRLPVALHHIC